MIASSHHGRRMRLKLHCSATPSHTGLFVTVLLLLSLASSSSVATDAPLPHMPSSSRFLHGEEHGGGAFLKRAGFVGMRGKKSLPPPRPGRENEDDEESWLLDDEDMIMMNHGMQKEDKRAGFVGMRGKKMTAPPPNQQTWLNQLLSKRAGFVGMRGKKAGGSTSEEKAWKRAGFVGMRGKKSDEEPTQPAAYVLDGSSGRALDRAAIIPLEWVNQISGMKARRGSSGFVGMRG